MDSIAVVGDFCNEIYHWCDNVASHVHPQGVLNILTDEVAQGMGGGVATNLRYLAAVDNTVKVSISAYLSSSRETSHRYLDAGGRLLFKAVDSDRLVTAFVDTNGMKWSTFDVVVISDYDRGYITPELVANIASKTNVILDTKRELGPWAGHVLLAKFNEQANELQKRYYAVNNLITLSSKGFRWREGGVKEEGAPGVSTIDDVGSGDAFTAAIAMGMVKFKDLSKALKWAHGLVSDALTQLSAPQRNTSVSTRVLLSGHSLGPVD